MMKPTLFVLAAGMGSRYGGLKQLDGLGPHGETIMDYSIYDAIHSGFGKIVFVIRKDFEQDFREKILSKYEGHIPVEVVFQSINDLPEGYACPADRTKPWGTNHAVLMGKDAIREPFAVINADDFYGRNAFEVMAKELSRERDRKGDYCMVGFRVGNTITDENGQVQTLEPTTPVSMNLWGFTPDYFDYSEREFKKFLDRDINTPKAEFFIPLCIDTLIKNGEATVKVLDTDSKWFGVTYSADRPGVVEKFAQLHADGTYPERLF